MKVRLLANDSKIPNLAIMKISSYHKKLGDDVDWYDPMFDMHDTDIFYESKIFTFSPNYQYYPIGATIIRGGTGIDIKSKLPDEIEQITALDYSLYPDCDYSIQFMSRGCIRKCPFCVVPIKEGAIRQSKPFELNPKGKWIMILDNNFFSCPALTRYIKPWKINCYVLVGFRQPYITDTDLERVLILKQLGVTPFAMGYIDFENPAYQKPQEIRDFCRWVNQKAVFNTVTWNEYRRSVKGEKKQ